MHYKRYGTSENKILIIITMMAGIILMIGFVIALFAGGDKEAITAEKFKSTMEVLNFKVTDITEIQNSKGGEQFDSLQVAKNENYQIELYNLSSVNKAKNLFEMGRVSKYDEEKLRLPHNFYSSPLLNYSYYKVTLNNKIILEYRVDDILLRVEAPKEYETEIDDIFSSMGC
jgi:hypothetical protein